MRAIDQKTMLWSTLALATAPLYEPAVADPRRALRRAVPWLQRARDTVGVWRDRSRGRQQLLLLDDHALRDIGITRVQAEAEANKPFWRA